jgi:hypothetical protein
MSEFEEITAKGLAEDLRDILFGIGRLFTGIYKKPKGSRQDIRQYDQRI